jgi:uncharacterized membrane protein YbhN (UPF0104 family)
VGLGFDALGDLDPAAWRPNAPVFVAASLAMVAGILFSGLLWGQVLRDLGGTSLSHAEAMRIFLIANLGRYIPGKVWQVAGLAVLARRRGVPGSLSGVSAVVAHGVSLTAAAVVGALVFAGAQPAHPGLRILVPAGTAALALLALFPPVFRLLVWALERVGLELDWTLLGPSVVFRWLVLFIVQWGVYGVSFLLLARSFGLPGDPLDVIAAYVAAYVVGYVAVFAPAGLGVREASLLALLAPSMGHAPAAGLAVIARIWSTVVEVIPAGVLWGLEVSRGAPEEVSPTGEEGEAQ